MTLLDVFIKYFIEHCQICKLHRDGRNIYIMPLSVTIDVKPFVFENVKLRTLLTFYGLAHIVLLQETFDFQHSAKVL